MSWQDRDYHRESSGSPLRSQFSTMSVTTWLLIINSVIFVLDMIFTGSQRASVISPFYWGNFNITQAVYGSQVWRWVTYQFIHDDILHILLNMIGLYFFGPMIEKWWGGRRFLAFYLLCGVSGAVIFTLLTLSNAIPTWMGSRLIGASGSIYGILLAAALVAPDMKVMLIFPPIPMKLRTMASVFLGIATLQVLVGSANAGGEAAHLGGALLGFLLIKQPWLLGWAESSARKRSLREQYASSSVSTGGESGGGGGSGGGESWGQKWEARKKEKAREEALRLEAEVDRILAKVKDQGLHSLTEREKQTLNRATANKRDDG